MSNWLTPYKKGENLRCCEEQGCGDEVRDFSDTITLHRDDLNGMVDDLNFLVRRVATYEKGAKIFVDSGYGSWMDDLEEWKRMGKPDVPHCL